MHGDRCRGSAACHHGPMATDRLRIGIVGCGDVTHRHYLPALQSRSDDVEVVAVADPNPRAGTGVVSAVAPWSPGARTYPSVEAMLDGETLDAVCDLTPAPLHGAVNRAILTAGVACYSEKPLASSLDDADVLVELAARTATPFLVAPGSAAMGQVFATTSASSTADTKEPPPGPSVPTKSVSQNWQMALPLSASRPDQRLQPAKRQKTAGRPTFAPSP